MKIRKVGVVGCGLMGSGIAETVARSGYETVVREVNDAALEAGFARLEQSMGKAVARGKLSEGEAQAARDRLRGTTQLADLTDCDLVVEAIVENPDEKRKLFAELDRICRPEAILASNTSSIPIIQMASATNRPAQVLGMHFMNPVPVMKLVELVRCVTTSDETLATGREFGESLGKRVIVAPDRAGFIVNLLLVPYLMEAIRALEAGVGTREDIDVGMVVGCGMPMGPLTLLDFVGLDTTYYIANILYDEFKDPRYAPPPLLKQMVLAGFHGRKSGRGFYNYAAGEDRPVQMGVILAADIGGTKLAAGVVEPDGALLATASAPTPAGTDPEALYGAFVTLLEQALRASGRPRAEVQAVGVGCGGPMRFPAGLVSPLNIPAWRDFPLRARLETDFGVPTLVDNDAKAFALGEHWRGLGRGSRSFLAMVVSTGVGGGVVEDGRLIHGAHGNAGHIGHVIVFPNGPRCACGARGCLEAVASGPSLVRRARAAIAGGTPSALPPNPTGRDLGVAAEAGDRLALQLYRQAGLALGRAIAAAAALFDLDRVVIGGGVAAAARFFLPSLRRELAARAQLDFTRGLPVEISADTVDSALRGAARMVLKA